MAVHVAEPATSAVELCEVGATAAMSGQTDRSASSDASSMVRVVALPKPPRTPLVDVELPGETMSRLDPSLLI